MKRSEYPKSLREMLWDTGLLDALWIDGEQKYVLTINMRELAEQVWSSDEYMATIKWDTATPAFKELVIKNIVAVLKACKIEPKADDIGNSRPGAVES